MLLEKKSNAASSFWNTCEFVDEGVIYLFFYPSSQHSWKLKINVNLTLAVHLSTSFWHLIFFTVSQFPLPSLHDALVIRIHNILSRQITPSIPIFLPDSAASPSIASLQISSCHLLLSQHVHAFPLLLCPEIHSAPVTSSLLCSEWYSFLSSWKGFDLLHITYRDFWFWNASSVRLCLPLGYFLPSFPYIWYLSGCKR